MIETHTSYPTTDGDAFTHNALNAGSSANGSEAACDRTDAESSKKEILDYVSAKAQLSRVFQSLDSQ